MPKRYRVKDPRLRFLDRFQVSDGCWNWEGFRDRDGYGSFWLNGRTERAHRASWLLLQGEIPAGKVVCHSCDNPSCIRPGHLWLGTPQENDRDALKKGRKAKGERIANSHLTPDKVREIRNLSAQGLTAREIASRVGTGRRNVSKVLTGENWSWVN